MALAIVPTFVIQSRAAVGTVEKSGQRIGFSQAGGAASGLAQFLCRLKSFLVNDRLLGVLKNYSAIFRGKMPPFVPEAGLFRLEIDGMAHVLHAVEDVRNGSSPPTAGGGKITVAPTSCAVLCKVGRR